MNFISSIKKSKRIKIRLLFLLLLTLTSKVFSQESYIQTLINKAEELELYNDEYWLLLVHYKHSFTGNKSLIDEKNFFLAENGKENPKAELEATIKAFFSPKSEESVHPTFKYTARYKWLCKKLEIDKTQLPYDGDTDYQAVLDTIKPKAFYLVFPAAYMNNPASMFGHLFFLIESENVSHLAGLAVNYGAITEDTPGIMYGIKGLFGLYPGRYDILPYYKQITEYSYLDMRDTWEYKLLLTPEENDNMLRHILEMRSTYSNYFFLNENCAFCLLFPIEAARPSTKLSERFGLIVEPIQVIQQLQKEKLLDQPNFRPSLYQKILTEKSFLSSKQKKLVKKICKGKISANDVDQNMPYFWDLAADYLKFLLSNNKITQQEYQKRFMEVLLKRKNLKQEQSQVNNTEIPELQPQKSHGSKMLSFGGGFYNQSGFGELKFRVLAHSLMDKDDGYTPNSQIEFFTGAARYNFSDNKIELQYLDIANIISMPICDTFIKKSSFQFRTGLESNLNREGNYDLAYRIKHALGFSNMLTKHNQFYAFAGADLYISPEYNYWTDILFGGETGIITTCGIWKQKIDGSIYQSPLDFNHTRFNLSAEESFAINQNISLGLNYSFSGDYRKTWHSAGCYLNLYF